MKEELLSVNSDKSGIQIDILLINHPYLDVEDVLKVLIQSNGVSIENGPYANCG
jgi:hypothetical protein